jgi:hypothetical protein
MSNSPVNFGGLLGAAAGVMGSSGIRSGGALGFLNRLTQRRKEGSGSRLKNLEKRVGSLENAGSQSPQQETMNKAMAARTGQVQGTVPSQQANALQTAGAIGTVGGALSGNIGVETASGIGQFNPETMQMNNNALSSDPLQGIDRIPEIISAPGPMTNSEDELGQLFEN